MSSPIYTATAGPADPNAPIRAKVYAGISAALGIVGFLATFKVLTADQALSIKDFAESGMNLAGSFGLGFAAVKTTKQTKNGTFDAPPPPAPVISTAQQIADAIPTVLQAAADKQAEVDLIKSVAANTFGQLPVVGGLAKDLINSIPSDLHLP